MELERPEVWASHRVLETERLIGGGRGAVLEVGAGDYSFAYVSKRYAGLGPWITVDLAPPCDVTIDLDDVSLRLPFADGHFNLAICTETLEHLRWPHALLSEVARVLAPGGRLVVSVPNAVSLSYRLSWLLGRIPSCAASGNLPPEFGGVVYVDSSDGALSGGHLVDFNADRLRRLLEFAGFRLRRLRGSGIIWHRQILPSWLVPPGLASNLIALAERA